MRILLRCSTLAAVIGLLLTIGSYQQRVEACFPCITLGPITITPVGVAPTPVVQKADEQFNNNVAPAVQQAGAAAVTAGGAAGTALLSPTVQLYKVIAGQESLSAAGQALVHDNGDAIASVGQAVSTVNGVQNNLKIVAARMIVGDVGGTIITLGTGVDRLTVEFAATAAIESGEVIGGKLRPEELIAAPLAAGIRAAENQFAPDAKPLPPDVREKLAQFYPSAVLENARWAVGSISISVPDVTNQYRKTFEDFENAVTVGHVTVFVTDPGQDYHWWAHEMQHQVQYSQWGIDSFAYKYVTTCHDVEQGAEDQAQVAVPNGQVVLGC
jgi:hypothetical protein